MGKFIKLLPLALLMCACGSNKQNDWSNLNLQGKVHILKETQYEADYSDGSLKKGNPTSEDATAVSKTSTFNKEGFLTEVREFDAFGQPTRTITYHYNPDGTLASNLIKEEGEVIEATSKITFRYDEKQRVIEQIIEDENEKIQHRSTTDYNDENLIETTTTYNSKGELSRRGVVQKNRKGFPTEIKIYNEKRELMNFRREEYGENERLKQMQILNADETEVMRASFTYDRNGNPLTQEAFDTSEGEAYLTVEYWYEYDNKGNWLRCVKSTGGVPGLIIEREIIYY